MADLVDLRKTLKKWESAFFLVHERKPGKNDIDEAPENIKGAYKKYAQLKKLQSQSSSASTPGITHTTNLKSPDENKPPPVDRDAGTDQPDDTVSDKRELEVWGSEFNKKGSDTVDKSDGEKKAKGGDSTYFSNLGRKLYEKSLKMGSTSQSSGTWRKPDTPRRGLTPYAGVKVRPFESTEGQTQDQSKHDGDTIHEPSATFKDETQTVSDTDTAAPFGKMFQKALSVTTGKGTSAKMTQERDSDIYMNRYKAQSTKAKHSILPGNLSKLVSKSRQKIEQEIEAKLNSFNDTFEDESTQAEKEELEQEILLEQEISAKHSWDVPVRQLVVEDMKANLKLSKRKKATAVKKAESVEVVSVSAGVSKGEAMDVGQDLAAKSSAASDHVDDIDRDAELGEAKAVARGGKNRVGRTRVARKKAGAVDDVEETEMKGNVKKKAGGKVAVTAEVTEVDYDAAADDDNDDDVVGVGRKRRGVKRKAVIESDDEQGDTVAGGGGTDYTPVEGKEEIVAPPVKKAAPTVKRQKTAKAVSAKVAGGPTQYAKPSRAPVKDKPISQDNFIKLNMKLKTYKRKGRQMTGSQYKRKMWKEKMAARSQSYGDACFKCGQSGHWASKCSGARRAAQDKYDKEPVQDEDFPSMQEAAMLARGIQLEQKTLKTPKTSTGSNKAPATTTSATAPKPSREVEVEEEEEDMELEFQSDIVRSRRESAPLPPAMRPLIECGEGETLPATPRFVYEGLKKFGFDKFRPGQEEAVMRILAGLSTLVVLSTGGGKSLCYKLPAYLYSQREPCICLVISPLVSLMEDQVTGLPQGVQGFCLHTNMTPGQREGVLAKVKEGQAQFLLVSPEAVAGGSMSLINSMSSLPPIAFVCIDEAHCLSEWSHNFRPSYLRLCKVLREKLGIQCFLGLTATATLSTAADVSRHLSITDFKRATVRGSPIPRNLYLSVSRDDNRDEALIGLLQGERFGSLDSIIVYCTRRDVTTRVATVIRTHMNKDKVPLEAAKGRKGPKLEWGAESYHAGLTASKRKSVQNAFMSGRLRVVAATVAFGMGLDKSDVRGIIHYNMPKSFESYVQEIGRAGRDGNPAQCHVFLDPEGKDLCELRRHTYGNTVDYKTLKKLVGKVFPLCRCRDVHLRHEQARKEMQNLEAMFDDDFDDDMLEELDTQTGDAACNTASNIPEDELNLDREVSDGDTKNAATDGADRTVTDKSKDVDEDSVKENKEPAVCRENDVSSSQIGANAEGTVTDKVIEDVAEDRVSDSKPADCGEDNMPATTRRVCQGHERALPIQQTVMELDVKEEGIATLLCYLELHSNQWLENLSNVYANCKIQCYGGPHQLQAVAKKCPPVAVAIARARSQGKKFDKSNSVEFSVVEISDMMGWDSGPVKKELKLLQWNFGQVTSRTGLMVEFADLAFHFRSLGDFSDEEYDDILQFLHSRVQRQETSELANLSRLYKALKGVSHRNYYMCCADIDMNRNNKLKAILNEYFDKQTDDEDTEDADEVLDNEPVPDANRDQVVSDIRQFYALYAHEHTITGRSVARIFHGIASPCFPATTWGRVRRFWRSHLDVDFNEVMKLATQELIRMRC